MSWKNLVKYFLHGGLFFFLFYYLQTLWSYIALILSVLGPFQTIAGLVVLLLIVGGLNACIAGGLDAIIPQRLQAIIPKSLGRTLQWRLWFTMKRSIFRILLQGLLLTPVLIVINFLLAALPRIVNSNQIAAIALFAITIYVDGRICKSIAGGLRGIED